ncbi:hypothetical protein T09_1144 [Trichinella sp. T9]|nr:hypothetical protein T09_1144 [Trichinella sp. T9]
MFIQNEETIFLVASPNFVRSPVNPSMISISSWSGRILIMPRSFSGLPISSARSQRIKFANSSTPPRNCFKKMLTLMLRFRSSRFISTASLRRRSILVGIVEVMDAISEKDHVDSPFH